MIALRAIIIAGLLTLFCGTAHAQFGSLMLGQTHASCPGGTFTTTQTLTANATGICVSTTSGGCVVVNGGGTVTIEASQIGPCGQNNSTNASQGIYITGNSTVNVYDSYIHVENQSSNCSTFDSHDGIEVANNGTAPVNVQGNVIAYNGANVRVYQASNVTVTGNFLLNPRGNIACSDPDNVGGDQVQAYGTSGTPNATIAVTHNYTISALTGYLYPANSSDQLNFGYTTPITASNNWIYLSQYANSGGITIDTGSTAATIQNNVISNIYNAGIAIATGSNHVISGNKIVMTASGPNAAGIGLIGSANAPAACGTIALTSNQSYAYQVAHSYVQGYYTDGYCTGVTLTSNTFDINCTTGVSCAAYAALNPLATTNPPPLIPPLPKHCAAKSPYTTQTSAPRCA